MQTCITHRFGSIVFAIVAIALSTWLNGCDDPVNQPVPDKARLRVVHLAYDAPNIDLRVNNGLVSTRIAYSQASAYAIVEPGSRRIAITDVGSDFERVQTTAVLEEGSDYTVFVFPPASFVTAQLRRDDRTLVPAGQARIRWVNGTSDGENLELRIADQEWMPSLAAGQSSEQALRSTGSVELIVFDRIAGRAVAAFQPATLENQTYTIAVHGTVNTTDNVPLGARVFIDGGQGTDFFDLELAVTTASVMSINALVGTTAVATLIDEIVVGSNMDYGESLPYRTVQQGSRQVRFTNGGTTVLATSFNAIAGKKYTVFASGTIVPPDVAPLAIEDVTIPNPAQALVRYVNLSPDAGSLDVIIPVAGLGDYKPSGMQGISFRGISRSASTGSNFLAFPPSPVGEPYTFTLLSAGTSTELHAATGISLQAGKIYTVWVGGRRSANSLRVFVVPHN